MAKENKVAPAKVATWGNIAGASLDGAGAGAGTGTEIEGII